MTTFDSPYLLDRFNSLTGRPAADAITATAKYGWLTEAQAELIAAVATICPHVLYPKVGYSSMPTLSTTDNQVFTFGNDQNGYPIAPVGKTQVYTSLSNIPDCPWREGLDYLNEGSQIRIPNNGTWSGTLYWRGITMPRDIDASNAPALYPAPSRILIPYIAALNFATAQTRNVALADGMRAYLGQPWGGNKGAFARWCTTWRTQFKQGGALEVGLTGRAIALLEQTPA